jgi:hypothetical protein
MGGGWATTGRQAQGHTQLSSSSSSFIFIYLFIYLFIFFFFLEIWEVGEREEGGASCLHY